MVGFLKRRAKNPIKTQENVNNKLDHVNDNDSVADNDESIKINIDRSVYNYPKFTRQYPAGIFTGFSLIALLSEIYVRHFKPSQQCASKQFRNRLPFIKMIKTYKIKEYLLSDIIAGITVIAN